MKLGISVAGKGGFGEGSIEIRDDHVIVRGPDGEKVEFFMSDVLKLIQEAVQRDEVQLKSKAT